MLGPYTLDKVRFGGQNPKEWNSVIFSFLFSKFNFPITPPVSVLVGFSFGRLANLS